MDSSQKSLHQRLQMQKLTEIVPKIRNVSSNMNIFLVFIPVFILHLCIRFIFSHRGPNKRPNLEFCLFPFSIFPTFLVIIEKNLVFNFCISMRVRIEKQVFFCIRILITECVELQCVSATRHFSTPQPAPGSSRLRRQQAPLAGSLLNAAPTANLRRRLHCLTICHRLHKYGIPLPPHEDRTVDQLRSARV